MHWNFLRLEKEAILLYGIRFRDLQSIGFTKEKE